MIHKIINKQPAAKDCFICGTENDASVKAEFYNLDDGRVICRFKAKDIHGGHPGILHGGVICSILDETAGRAMSVLSPGTTGALTMQLDTSFKAVVPTNLDLMAVGWLEEVREKVYISRSEIFLPDGTVAAYCRGVYYRLKDPSKNDHYHKVYPQVQDRFEIDVPDTEGPWVTEMPEELKK